MSCEGKQMSCEGKSCEEKMLGCFLKEAKICKGSVIKMVHEWKEKKGIECKPDQCPADVKAMFEEMKNDPAGLLSFEEFKGVMMKVKEAMKAQGCQ